MPQFIGADSPFRSRRDQVREARQGRPDPDFVARVAATEARSLGSLPTSVAYAGAMAATDDREAARWAVVIARQLDLPAPPAVDKKTLLKRKPEPLVDPLTGEPISRARAEQTFQMTANIAGLLEGGYRPLRGYKPPDPASVASYVSATALLPDLPAETALAASLEMDKVSTPIERLRGNISVINAWNEDVGELDDVEILTYAKWWADNKEMPITSADLVTLTTPELTEAIRSKKIGLRELDQWSGRAANNQAPTVTTPELEQLITARDKAISNPNFLDDARRILSVQEAPTWVDRTLSWAGAQLDQLWKTTQHVAVDIATLPVLALEEAQALAPGGTTFKEAYHETLRDRSYLIQRVNAGESIGQIYHEAGYIPSWAAAGFDFAVGIAFDPFVLGGRLVTGARAVRVAPELLEGATTGRALAAQRTLDWFARIQWDNFGGSAMKFSRGRSSRRLFDAAYDQAGDKALFRQIDRLASHFETRSALEYEYMSLARAELLARYPRASEKAWAEWQTIMRSHFGLAAPPGSVAERVLAARSGMQIDAVDAVISKPKFLMGRRVAPERSLDDIITEQASPLITRYEVPHRLWPVPMLGGYKLGRMRFAESMLGNTNTGLRMRSLFNPNPGAVLRPGHNPEVFFQRKATRWREFSEPEIREFQARAINIKNSGVGVETRLQSMLEEMDFTAMTRITNRMGLEPEAAKEAIETWTKRVRSINEQAVFGVSGKRRGTITLLDRPITETQLVDEIVSLDPIMVRKFLKRYDNTFAELSASMSRHGLPDVAKAAFATVDTSRDFAHAAMRTWKFMVVPKPAYIARVILLDENLRFLSTTGSLLERFASLELKKGVRGLVGKGLKRPLGETVRVGNEVIDIPRTGTYGYEPLANQQFRIEDGLDDMIRRTGTQDRALRALGDYGIVRPDMPQHLASWMRALNLQLGNSVPGRVALTSIRNGGDIRVTTQALRRWAKEDGYVTLTTRIGRPVEDVDEWSETLARMVDGYTMGDAEIADAAITRSVAEDMLNKVEQARRPIVHGPLVEALTAASGGAYPLKRFVERWYTMMVRSPENVLNRQPFYRVWKRRAERAQYRALQAQGYNQVEIVETIGQRKLVSALVPEDASQLRRLAAMDDRQFLDEMRSQGVLFDKDITVRGDENFTFNAQVHGIPDRPDSLEVGGPTSMTDVGTPTSATDLGQGVRRYKYADVGDEGASYAVWEGDELQGFLQIPKHEGVIETDSIIIRVRPGAAKDTTAKLADAAMRDFGLEETVVQLIHSGIPVSRKGALAMRRRIIALTEQSEEVITRAEKLTKPITQQMRAAIDASSRDFALAQVKKVMFDFTENTRFAEMAGALFPFFQPWMEAYQVWGHILVHRNPAMIGFVNNAWRVAVDNEFIRKDPDTGQWVMPWSAWSRLASMMPWVNGDKLPEGLGMVAPLSGVNLFLTSTVELGGLPIPAPSLNPVAQIPLKAFFAETENPALASYLFGYGPGVPLVSAWMEKAVRAIKPDAFNDDRDDATAMDFLRLYQYLGTDKDENGQPIPFDQLKARALDDAKRINAMYATIGFVAPTRGSITFPEGYEAKEDELNQLRDVLGFEQGTDRFLEKYPELTLMTVGKTVDTRRLDDETAPRLPASEAVQRLFRQPQFARFAKRFPAWTGMLVLSADEQWDNSTLEAFSEQVHAGAVRYKGLDQFLLDGQIPGFWNAVDGMYAWYNPLADQYEAQGLGDDNEKVIDLKDQKAMALYGIYLRYPQYAKKLGIRPDPNLEGHAIWDGDAGTPPSEIVVAQARQITQMQGFENFPAIQGLKAYLALRDATQREMERAGISNIGDTTAQRHGGQQVATGAITLNRDPVEVYVQGEHPRLQSVAERAVALWNNAVGGTVLRLVADGSRGAVPIRLANERNGWYDGAFQIDEEAEFTQGQVRGTTAALLNEVDLTLAHELGHALGLDHPLPVSTSERFVPATERRIDRLLQQPGGGGMFRVAPVGLMGNEMHKNDPDFRGLGPSEGEIEFLRERFGAEPVVEFEGGLTETWEAGKAQIIERFPEVEPFLNAFFDDDLEGLPSKGERRKLKMQRENPERYDSYLQSETRLEQLADATVVADSTEARDRAYGQLNDYVDTLYETKQDWKLRLWFDSKSFSAQETYLEGLQTRPPVFYSTFDWELQGVKLSPTARGWIADIDSARAQIEEQSNREALGQRGEFLSGEAYESLDHEIAIRMKQDRSFATAVRAMRTWGWGLWQSDLTKQQGKAGYAWRTIEELTRGVNEQAMKIGLHGPDSFDSAEYKQAYLLARQALSDRIEEFAAWSPVFGQQVIDIQRTQLRGEPFVEWLMPNIYFPIGIVGD